MKVRESDWYKKNWSLSVKDESWVEETEKQVEFIIRTLGLTGGERILDLACGYGRHSLAFAKRGFRTTGVDITPAYIEDAWKSAGESGLSAEFILSDIRDLRLREEFDVVLNLADGAIGYLENDAENLRLFDVIAGALKPGGKHFMDICNAEHAERFFPKRHWDIGDKTLSLPEFDWDGENRRMLFGGWSAAFGEIARKPEEYEADSIRLYTRDELWEILEPRQMKILRTFSDYEGKAASLRELQLMVYSQKSAF